ncbi:MAG: hypothetical protein QOI73_2717 [Solirubrobacteraceae bacterium]|nr:hypothetical protein [Solirubrobacteraceae bacterium]
MPALLRNFLYLDERLTSQYLAQLEGGTYAEEDQSTKDARNRGGEAGAKVGPLAAKGSKGSAAEEISSRRMRQTAEGDYRRLEKLLDAEDAVQWLDAFDDDIWNGLERGEALRIESVVNVPTFLKYTEMAAEFGPLMELMQTFGETVDEETQEAVTGLTQIGQTLKELTVVARAAGAPKYKFICPLKRQFLREDMAALDGECIVVGSLQRRLKAGERYSILDALGMGGLPRAERRKAERDMKKDMPDSVVSAPAALVTPLAIYR